MRRDGGERRGEEGKDRGGQQVENRDRRRSGVCARSDLVQKLLLRALPM